MMAEPSSAGIDSDTAGSGKSSPKVEVIDGCNVEGFDGHERVFRCTDKDSGLRAYIAIHNSRLGPALGGCRMWPYASDRDALADVLRLSQGMSFKHAIAGTDQGGGKAVIVVDGRPRSRAALFQAFGRCVERLGGHYITAEDVGTTVNDMVIVSRETRHVAGLPREMGGGGDPSPMTAYGVFRGIQSAVAFHSGLAFHDALRLDGITVAVQGLGNVGCQLCRLLDQVGARLQVTDTRADRVADVCARLDAEPVPPDDIYEVDADVFAPCALGGILNADTAERLRARVVAGAANNQLAGPEVADRLHELGILYAPDYVINAGGIINISLESGGYDPVTAQRLADRIAATLTAVFHGAKAEDTSPAHVADRMATEILSTRSSQVGP